MHVHVNVLPGLDHIQIDKILLLGPEQLIPSEVCTGIHIGVDPPSSDKLSKWYLIHAHGGLLVLGGGGLGCAAALTLYHGWDSSDKHGNRSHHLDTKHKNTHENMKDQCKCQGRAKRNK